MTRDGSRTSGEDRQPRADERHDENRADERHHARLTEIVDRHGFVHARLSWDGDALVELVVAGAIIRGAIIDDPLLGRAHEIVAAGPAIDASSRGNTSSSAESSVTRALPTSNDTHAPSSGSSGTLASSTSASSDSRASMSAKSDTPVATAMSAKSDTPVATTSPAKSNAPTGTAPVATASPAKSNAPTGTAPVATAMSAKSNRRVLTTISTIDWARPTEIPAIAAPGALPPGAGGAIMNVLAILAQRAGVTELRYAGPYPTHALFSTLARSFRTTTTEDEFTSAFADRAARVARGPMDAVFVPAPHERIAIVRERDTYEGRDRRDAYGFEYGDEDIEHDEHGIEYDDEVEIDVHGIIELRDGIERATIDGITYARGDGIARLVELRDVGEIKPHESASRTDDARTDDARTDDARTDDARTDDARTDDARTDDARTDDARTDDARTIDARLRHAAVRAEVWFADELYARVATLDARGELVDGPHPIPPCDSEVIGKAFPRDMTAALAELIAELVPAPLATAASDVVAGRTLRWADLGARAAARVGDELQLHAALWRVSRFGMARLAMALVEALVPIVTPLAAARVAH